MTLAGHVDHIAHLVEVAGEEHVGITDFDGMSVGFEEPPPSRRWSTPRSTADC